VEVPVEVLAQVKAGLAAVSSSHVRLAGTAQNFGNELKHPCRRSVVQIQIQTG
jgi:hypothetical protein